MTLRAVYERFLSAPNAQSLAEHASLHYVTTLTTVSESGAILRHLEAQNKSVVKKKSEKTIGCVEGADAIAIEVETTLEFIAGGGAYLPGLENFVTDRIVVFPATHVVHFDEDNKVRLIRISWDQGSLLKQVEVIGSRGKNWPIVDGKDQARLIASSGPAATPTTTAAASAAAAPLSPRGREASSAGHPARSMSPNKKHIKDPHASLDLFGPAKTETRRESQPAGVAPRASAKPPQREMSELFAAGHEDYEPSQQNGGSPRKVVRESVIAPKGAGSQKFLPSRLFEEEADVKAPAGYKSDPAKYNHFNLGDSDEEDPLQHKATRNAGPGSHVPMRPRTDKHQSQWDFADFTTPAKVTEKVRGEDVRHFDLSDDESAGAETPGKHAALPKPRRDAETHFEFQDDGTGAESRRHGPAKGAFHRDASAGLYDNHVFDDGTEKSLQGESQPLKTITNNQGRKNDFGAHWEMTDASPAPHKANHENKRLGGDQNKAIKMMGSNWDNYDDSPEPHKKPAASGAARKAMESHWGHGAQEENVLPTRKSTAQPPRGLWDF